MSKRQAAWESVKGKKKDDAIQILLDTIRNQEDEYQILVLKYLEVKDILVDAAVYGFQEMDKQNVQDFLKKEGWHDISNPETDCD